jgi:hypothetical protein
MTRYNGWANRETWNVALWIGNDEGLYNSAREFKGADSPYKAFVASLEGIGGAIEYQTPDGVSWNDSGLDVEELDSMIREL